MRCEEECLQCWSVEGGAERWIMKMVGLKVPVLWTCNGESRTSKPAAVMSRYVQVMAGSRSKTLTTDWQYLRSGCSNQSSTVRHCLVNTGEPSLPDNQQRLNSKKHFIKEGSQIWLTSWSELFYQNTLSKRTASCMHVHWSTLCPTLAAKFFSTLHISLVDSILLQPQPEERSHVHKTRESSTG